MSNGPLKAARSLTNLKSVATDTPDISASVRKYASTSNLKAGTDPKSLSRVPSYSSTRGLDQPPHYDELPSYVKSSTLKPLDSEKPAKNYLQDNKAVTEEQAATKKPSFLDRHGKKITNSLGFIGMAPFIGAPAITAILQMTGAIPRGKGGK